MHTNETVNYGLSQFVGSDIPNPLTDYNGDMQKIDTAIKNVADSSVTDRDAIADLKIQNGDETLETTAQTLSGAINELNTEYGDVNTRLTVAEGKITADEGTLATAVSNISTLAGKVSDVETKVGNAVLDTTASDLSNAINELKGEIDGTAGGTDSINARLTNVENDVDTLTARVGSVSQRTLAAGATTVSFTVPTTGDYIVDFFSSDGSNYKTINTSVAGTVTLTYDADSSNARVISCEVKGV